MRLKLLKICIITITIGALIYGLSFIGGKDLTIDFFEVGRTTLDEVFALDPTTNPLGLATGIRTKHVLDNGTKVIVSYEYNDGEFIVTAVDVISE